MSWREASAMSLRRELVTLALGDGANIRQVCRHFDVSPKTGYKWIGRWLEGGVVALQDRSRRPHHSPRRTAPHLERAVLDVRDAHPTWCGRKIRDRLLAIGMAHPPSASTITEILRRHGRLDPGHSRPSRAWQRFEAPAPNALWQMDFKGHFPLSYSGRCHPLTVLDDHSRFALGLRACPNERGATVQEQLIGIFRRYGLPDRILVDNGSPWGSDAEHVYTPLTAWLIRLGIGVAHSAPYHPQTLGKDERFHRTVKAEAIGTRIFRDLDECQRRFDQWRDIYNFERPHDSLGRAVPGNRYQLSRQSFPETLPSIEYGPQDLVRKVQANGEIYFRQHAFHVGKAFRGQPVGLRPTTSDGVWDVHFCHQKVATIHLTAASAET